MKGIREAWRAWDRALSYRCQEHQGRGSRGLMYLRTLPYFKTDEEQILISNIIRPSSQPVMATLILLRRPLAMSAIGLGITTAFAMHSFHRSRPLLCDASPAARNLSNTFRTYSEDARVPIFRNGRPNPAAYRQLSAGSISGMSWNPLPWPLGDL